MIERLARWFDQRLRAVSALRAGATKVFPEHWSFMVGEIALYSFVVLVLTGTYLALFFDAGMERQPYTGSYVPLRGVEVSAAYRSALDLSFDVRAGRFVRQVHHWAALVFVAAIVVHLLRVFFTGAFRRPRELNWIVGVTLLLLAILTGFAGYSLLDDLLSGVGLRIGFSILESIPIVGEWLAFGVFGGPFPGDVILGRLFIAHVFVLPLLILGLLTVHLLVIFRQKHTQFPGELRTEDNVVGDALWPTYAAKSVGLLFIVAAVLAALGGFAQINPIWLYGPYEPATVTSGAQPDWYMGWLEGALRLMPPVEVVAFGYEIPSLFFPAVLLPGVTFAGLYLYPFVEQWVSGASRREHHLLDRPRDHLVRTSLGVAVFTFYAVLLVAGANDIIADVLDVPIGVVVGVLRVALFVLPVAAAAVAVVVCRQLRRSDVHAGHKEAVRQAADTH